MSRHNITLVMALAALILTGATLVARTLPVSGILSLVLSVGAPYAVMAAAVGSCMVWRRRRPVAIAGIVIFAVAGGVQLTWYYLGRPPRVSEHEVVRVMVSNLNRGMADATSLVRIASANADVITVAELTPEATQRYVKAGIDRAFPFSHLMAGPDATGIGIWSRYPLMTLSVPRKRDVWMPAARVRVPGVRFDPVIASVHVTSPLADRRNNVGVWRTEMTGAKAKMDDFSTAAGLGAVIVGGDYNSTPDARQFRGLLSDGYRDAVDQSGSGFAPTFPSDAWYPPVITIDHVLTRNAVATSVRTFTVDGSDHRALVATVAVPRDPGP